MYSGHRGLHLNVLSGKTVYLADRWWGLNLYTWLAPAQRVEWDLHLFDMGKVTGPVLVTYAVGVVSQLGGKSSKSFTGVHLISASFIYLVLFSCWIKIWLCVLMCSLSVHMNWNGCHLDFALSKLDVLIYLVAVSHILFLIKFVHVMGQWDLMPKGTHDCWSCVAEKIPVTKATMGRINLQARDLLVLVLPWFSSSFRTDLKTSKMVGGDVVAYSH